VIKVNGQDVEVLATNGVAKLGGLDFDLALQKIVQKKYKTLTGDDLLPEDFTRNDAEEEKKALSSRTQITVRVARKIIEIKRDEFEESISSLITQAEMLCEATLDEAGITVDQVQGVFLVGGSTRIPLVTESVRRVFQREPTVTANVDEVVALGAALYAAYKGDKSKLSSAQKTSIGKLKVSESTSKYFGTLSIGRNDHRNEDVVTNSILIHKGQKIPCSVTESFYTRHDGQEAVTCQVTESAAPETDPRFVKVIWKGALKLPAGRPRGQEIRVTFAYDENQIMKCSFVDVATGADTKIDLSMSSAAGTDTDEINKFMVA
jgi:molecular chaperone DnaK (HSP70)